MMHMIATDTGEESLASAGRLQQLSLMPDSGSSESFACQAKPVGTTEEGVFFAGVLIV